MWKLHAQLDLFERLCKCCSKQAIFHKIYQNSLLYHSLPCIKRAIWWISKRFFNLVLCFQACSVSLGLFKQKQVVSGYPGLEHVHHFTSSYFLVPFISLHIEKSFAVAWCQACGASLQRWRNLSGTLGFVRSKWAHILERSKFSDHQFRRSSSLTADSRLGKVFYLLLSVVE